MSRKKADFAFFILFLAFSLLQAATIAYTPLTLSPDETHYWEWSRRLDLAYYSKGPLIAWLIRLSTIILGDTPYSIRGGGAFCYAIFTIIFYLYARKEFSPAIALYSWLTLRCMPAFAQMGFLMTTDSLAALFWLLAIISAQRALEGKHAHWLLFGFFAGAGTLAKYTAALLIPSLVIYLRLSPELEARIAKRWFITGMSVFAITVSPVLIWNHRHDWVNFAHNAGHLGAGQGLRFKPTFLLELVGGQAALAGPIVLAGIVYAMYLGISHKRIVDETLRFYSWMSAPLLIMVVLLSFTKRVYANWPIPVYIGGLLALTRLFGMRPDLIRRPWISRGLIVNALLTACAHLLVFGYTFGLPVSRLPTKKLMGWDTLGQTAGRILAEHAQAPTPFVLCEYYGTCSVIAFYAPGHPEVYISAAAPRRMNQYDIWQNQDTWEGLKGRSALIVLQGENAAAELKTYFRSFTELEPLTVKVSGSVVRDVRLYWGEEYLGGTKGLPKRY